MKTKLSLTVLLFAILTITSCSIQKRVHQPGLNVEWNIFKKKHTASSLNKKQIPPKASFVKENIDDQTMNASQGEISSADILPLPDFIKPLHQPEKTLLDSCDKIILKNGDELLVRITGATETSVEYKDCNDSLSATKSINSSELFIVKYASGLKLNYNTQNTTPKNEPNATPNTREIPGIVIVGISLAVAGLLIAGIPLGLTALVLGIVGLAKINKDPLKYKGQGLAILAIILGLLDIIGAAIAISMMK